MTYESLPSLPDFSGWWYWDVSPEQYLAGLGEIPLKPQGAAVLKSVLEGAKAGKIPDLGAQRGRSEYCGPAQFGGQNGGVSIEIEFLFTPGRVTITDEAGVVRRIYLSDRPPRADADESDTGTSVGHWEGRTLVVQTVGFNSHMEFIGPIDFGHNVRLTERFTLKGPDELEIASRMTAPEILTVPWEQTLLYRRDHGHTFHEAVSCVDDDRSIDPTTGRQRFDLTPPTDLPPPPG
ncbi:MAG TPA: hypothetical protein VMU67_09070 [Steroidobacteraceae bacterium]|nr:hypothetical protein [Steroidobacteraceae bacterium]